MNSGITAVCRNRRSRTTATVDRRTPTGASAPKRRSAIASVCAAKTSVSASRSSVWKRQLDAARRAGFRQATPFAKPLKRDPHRPRRKAGRAYGRKGHRRIPPRVDERYDVPLPARCPTCAEPVVATAVATQYQEELPMARVVVRQFDLHVGRCIGCGRRVQGRHPLQTSDAIGAAAAQLGAQVIALVVVLNKQLGLSFAKIAILLRQLYGLTVTRSALVHTVHRTARQARPPMTRGVPTCAAVRWSVRTKRAGRSLVFCNGSGSLRPRTRPCTAFSPAEASRKRRRSSGRILPACSCVMAGRRIGN